MPQVRQRHQPEKTVLYAVVRAHLDGFLRSAREHGALPAFIERTFRAYLKCGIPEHGFIRVHCPGCGHDDIVAFSCKRRGVCPSCSARGMGDGAAHLVDHVLPAVPYRQWVVGFPFELNGPLAFQPGFLAATERLVVDALCRWQKARAGGEPQLGGIHVRHRFGGSLNLHIHGHILLMDGVYRKNSDGGALTFQQTPPPREEELKALAETIHRRLLGLMKRRGMLRKQTISNEEQQLDALAACGQLALTPGKRERSGPALAVVEEDEVENPRSGTSANVNGVNVYASSPVDGADRETLERLCRYLLRGPLALHRLKQRPDGLLTYRLKKPDRRGNTVLVLSPNELLARLCSLIPAPGHPTRKYFGVLAGGARDRKLVVPKPTHRKRGHAHPEQTPTASPVKWAELLRRVWGMDALECPKCKGRMTAMAVVENPEAIARYLGHTGQATVHPRAQAPPELAA